MRGGSEALANELRQLPETLLPQTAPGVCEAVFGLLPSNGSTLVAGAGRGGLSLVLARSGFEVTSVDLHPDHFKAPGLECGHADLNKPLTFKSESFDIVIAVEVIEHLENPWGFLREALRVLRPSGSIIVTTPNVASLPARLSFLRSGQLPYFKMESFVGCYHVTPIFPWAVERWAQTANARVHEVKFSRANWPDSHDVPRYYENPIFRYLKRMLPIGQSFGEIACFRIEKTQMQGPVAVGQHYS